MRKAISIISWVSVVFTTILLVLTMLSTYLFTIYIAPLSNYYLFQCFFLFTMIIWSIKLYNLKESHRRTTYSAFCLLIAAGTVFFMVMNVR